MYDRRPKTWRELLWWEWLFYATLLAASLGFFWFATAGTWYWD